MYLEVTAIKATHRFRRTWWSDHDGVRMVRMERGHFLYFISRSMLFAK